MNPVEVRVPEFMQGKNMTGQKIFMLGDIVNACVGSFLYGYFLVSFNGISTVFINRNDYRDKRIYARYETVINAAFPLGCLFGTTFMYYVVQKTFKDARKIFIFTDFYTIVVGILMVSSYNPVIMTFTRFLMGFLMSINTNFIPMFIRQLS